jgi:hypothetical protein
MLSAEVTQSKRQYKEDSGYKIYPISLDKKIIQNEFGYISNGFLKQKVTVNRFLFLSQRK